MIIRSGARLALSAAILLLTSSSCGDITGQGNGSGVRVLWKAPLGGVDKGLHAPATDGERLYALVGGGLFAYDINSGKVTWRARYARYMPRNVFQRDGRVFLTETVALAFDAATGRELWRSLVDSASDFAWSFADDQALYTGTRSHRLYAFDVRDGALRWNVDIGPDWRFGGIVSGVVVRGDTLYAAAEQPYSINGHVATGWLVALDKHTGRILWKFQNGRGEDLRNFITPPTVAGRLLLASDRKGNAVVAVDRFTGQEVWRVNGIMGYIGFTDPPVVVNDTVYAASGDTYVYALDLPTGRVLWKTRTPAAVNAFTVCGDYVLANYQGLAVLDRHTGRVLRTMLDAEDEFLTTGFAQAGTRAFVLGTKAVYALSCE